MFSCKDLEGFVAKASSALELKFGETMPIATLSEVLSMGSKVTFCRHTFHNVCVHILRICFCAVRREADIFDASLAFPAKYTHQVFGER